MLRFACPNCSARLKAAADQAGQALTCPRCRTASTVPEAAVATLDEPAAGVATSRTARGRGERNDPESPTPKRPSVSVPVWAFVAGGVGVLVLLLVGAVVVVVLASRDRTPAPVVQPGPADADGDRLQQWLVGTWEAFDGPRTFELTLHKVGHYTIKLWEEGKARESSSIHGKWVLRGDELILTIDSCFGVDFQPGTSKSYNVETRGPDRFFLRDPATGGGTMHIRKQ